MFRLNQKHFFHLPVRSSPVQSQLRRDGTVGSNPPFGHLPEQSETGLPDQRGSQCGERDGLHALRFSGRY
jgi:hypothetical protein